jgi:hypothetical protein
VPEQGIKGDHTGREATTRSAWVMASCCPAPFALKAGSAIKSPLPYQLSYAPSVRRELTSYNSFSHGPKRSLDSGAPSSGARPSQGPRITPS